MPDATLQRLDSQYEWYDAKAKSCQLWFRGLKITQILVAAAIPVAATADASAVLTGTLGAVILLLESLQQLYQFQQNWITYRGTAEGLISERYLFGAQAGPYAGVAAPGPLLAERVEALLATERSGWAASQLPPGPGATLPPPVT